MVTQTVEKTEEYDWKSKAAFYTKKENYTKIDPKPYEIYTADFGERLESNVGSEITKVRPCIILTRTNYNRKSGVVTVVPISNKKFASKDQMLVDDYFLNEGKVEGIVKIEMITTISKGRLGQRIGKLNHKGMLALSSKMGRFLKPLNKDMNHHKGYKNINCKS